MSSKSEIKTNRDNLHFWLGTYNTNTPLVDIKELVRQMNIRAESQEQYGVANQVDFRELTPLFAALFAYDNKRFYIYKAISDPTKIGYLSRRQYIHMQWYIKKLQKQGIGGSSFVNSMDNYLKDIGTMASPYRLIKRAFKENPNARYLARFFPLGPDKKTTQNEELLIEICNTMMNNSTAIEFHEASVQECYDLRFSDHISGSGNRYATNSCMCGKHVGGFYEAFGAKGMMVYWHGVPVGRFLFWTLPNGEQYVDRLYIRESLANDTLAEIDRQFPKAHKYPVLRDSSGNSKQVMIPLVNPSVFEVDWSIPYVDTFGSLMFKDGQYFLSNFSDQNNGYKYVTGLRSTSSSQRFKSCPYCKQLMYTGNYTSNNDIYSSRHKLYCKGYIPRAFKDRACIDIFRNSVSSFKELAKYDRNRYNYTFGFAVFEV